MISACVENGMNDYNTGYDFIHDHIGKFFDRNLSQTFSNYRIVQRID